MHHFPTILREGIQSAESLIRGVPTSDFEYKASPEKWSKKEILGHLIDSAYNNHQRFLRAGTQDTLIFRGYDQVNWVVQNRYQQREKEEVLATWIQINRHLAFLIEGIPEEKLLRKTTDHNFHQICSNLREEGEPCTLAYLIWDYLYHLEHHLTQITEGAYSRMLPPFAKES